MIAGAAKYLPPEHPMQDLVKQGCRGDDWRKARAAAAQHHQAATLEGMKRLMKADISKAVKMVEGKDESSARG